MISCSSMGERLIVNPEDWDCGGSCDGGSVVKKKKEVTLMKTRLLRKGQSSGSDTMLEIQNDCIVFHKLKNIHQCLYIGGICVRYK